MTTRALATRALLGVVVAVIVLASVFPFFWMLLTSLKPDSRLFTKAPSFSFSHLTFSRYTHLFHGNIPTQFRNSLIVAVGTTVLTGVIALLAGYALARYRLRLRHVLMVVILATQLLPQTILVVPLFKVYKSAHLLNTYQGLILSHLALTVGLCTYMLRSFLVEIPVELEEAALVDGASRLRALRSIVLPLAWPGIAASSVYAFITSWNELMFSATYMQRPAKETLPVALQQFFSSYYTDWGGVMAASIMFTVPVVIFFLIVQKRLMQGIAVGALKG
jgi:N,N'-diacetylchitobiose transport system permease protein